MKSITEKRIRISLQRLSNRDVVLTTINVPNKLFIPCTQKHVNVLETYEIESIERVIEFTKKHESEMDKLLGKPLDELMDGFNLPYIEDALSRYGQKNSLQDSGLKLAGSYLLDV